MISGSIWSQSSRIDTLHNQLFSYIDKEGNDTIAFNLAEDLFFKTIDISPSAASEYGAICNQIALELDNPLLIARSQNLRGISFMKQKTFFMATEAFFEAYEIYIKYNDKADIAFTLLNIANSYIEQNLEDIAETKILEALEIYRKLSNSTGVARAYRLMGKTYYEIDDYLSIEYFEKAEAVYFSINSQIELATTYNFMAIAYLNLGKDKISIDYLTKALEIFTENNLTLKQADTYALMGDVFFHKKAFLKANKYYKSAKEIYIDKKSIEQITEVIYKIALVNFNVGNYDEAIRMSFDAIKYAESTNNLKFHSYSYKIISDSYYEKENLEKALKYSNLYQETLTKYYEEKSNRNFSAFQMNLEIQNIQREIEFLKITNEKNKLQYVQEQYNRNIIFTSILGFLALLYIIFMIYRIRGRKKAEKKLKSSNAQLVTEIKERKKAEIEAQRNEERYKLVFRKTPIGIIQFDENLSITNANERFSEIFNKTSKEVKNLHLNRIFDRSTVQKISELINSNEEVVNTTTEVPTKQKVVYVSLTIKKYNIWTKDGDISGGVIILEDLTEHKQAERYYKANIKSKIKLIKQLPDDLILLDKNNKIQEIHFPDAPEREISVSKLEDVFSERHAAIFKSHLVIANKDKKNTQFFFSDGSENFLVRIIPTDTTNLIIISHFEAEAKDAGIIVRSNDKIPITSKEKYFKNLQDDIDEELLPIYQNIQRGLSFIMIKGFAEKTLELGNRYNNIKIIDFGEQLFDYVTSFNIVKVNKQLEKFPSLVSEFMGISTKLV